MSDSDQPVSVGNITEIACQALLDAIDRAFFDVLHGRYGGGISALLTRGGSVLCRRVLRPVPVGVIDEIELDLGLRGGEADGRSGAMDLTPVGIVTLKAPPERGIADVHVVTEVYDEHDPNEAGDAGCLSTGLLLTCMSPGQAGQMPGLGVKVIRSGGAMAAGSLASRQGQRGWLPSQPRGQVNRAGGIGSNGFRRSPIAGLTASVSRPLLASVSDRVAQVPDIGPALGRMVMGLRVGDVGAS